MVRHMVRTSARLVILLQHREQQQVVMPPQGLMPSVTGIGSTRISQDSAIEWRGGRSWVSHVNETAQEDLVPQNG